MIRCQKWYHVVTKMDNKTHPHWVSILEEKRVPFKVIVALKKPVELFDHSDVIYVYNTLINIYKIPTWIFLTNIIMIAILTCPFCGR